MRRMMDPPVLDHGHEILAVTPMGLLSLGSHLLVVQGHLSIIPGQDHQEIPAADLDPEVVHQGAPQFEQGKDHPEDLPKDLQENLQDVDLPVLVREEIEEAGQGLLEGAGEGVHDLVPAQAHTQVAHQDHSQAVQDRHILVVIHHIQDHQDLLPLLSPHLPLDQV